jgi:hypothetical protein
MSGIKSFSLSMFSTLIRITHCQSPDLPMNMHCFTGFSLCRNQNHVFSLSAPPLQGLSGLLGLMGLIGRKQKTILPALRQVTCYPLPVTHHLSKPDLRFFMQTSSVSVLQLLNSLSGKRLRAYPEPF